MALLEFEQNTIFVQHGYGAGWLGSFVKASDMAPFGPNVQSRDELAEAPPQVGAPKPVRYAPVKRQEKADRFSAVTISIDLFEPGRQRSVGVKAWDGAEVELEVANLWEEQKPRSVKLKGKVQGLRCVLKIDPDTVKKWLDPAGPFAARINENLFDFRFRIPSVQISGKPFAGESSNRLFFYRRKLLVFFPGVFGSQVQVTAPDGQVLGFPDFTDETVPPPTSPEEAIFQLSQTAMKLKFPIEKVGALECDAEGRPLAEPKDPKLLMMTVPVLGPQVYSIFSRLHEARLAHFQQLPPGFLLYRLFAAPYDWRVDLTETATAKLKQLQKIQEGEFGRKAPDSDDEIAVLGHSTGGLIIRRMLAEPGADSVISHAFFMNVPFRGAPKPMAVIPTGQDPMGGESMIPIIDPRSLRSIALSAPIVYHLSVSEAYDEKIFFLKGEKGQAEGFSGPTAVKKWVELAIENQLMPNRKVVTPRADLSLEKRQALAFDADTWAQYWDDRFARRRGRTILEWARPGEKDGWEERELSRRKLQAQNSARVEQGWSDALAERAAQFHAACEKVGREGVWKDRAFIFYSVGKKATTLSIEARQVFRKEYTSLVEFLVGVGIPVHRLTDETIEPAEHDGSPEPRPMGDLQEEGVRVVELWSKHGTVYRQERWRFATLRQVEGDGTVPLRSLLGFGGPVTVFKKLVHGGEDQVTGPLHQDAPNHPWAWARVIDVLQGHDVEEYLANVDPVRGVDRDDRLPALRNGYRTA
jgi:hypothetical protein